MLYKKINKKYNNKYLSSLVEITGIPYMKKVTELYDTEFGGIPPEF
jgi:hypothetical protein